MGKGFEVFMENPYWRKIYDEAPSEYLKEYYLIMFDTSPFVMGDDYIDEEVEVKLRNLWLSKDEIRYLRDHAGIAQAKGFYQKCIDRLDKSEENLSISASIFRGEMRNPWYEPEEAI